MAETQHEHYRMGLLNDLAVMDQLMWQLKHQLEHEATINELEAIQNEEQRRRNVEPFCSDLGIASFISSNSLCLSVDH
ncbi:unnamed protein product [Periconia digitata]|uniref:Uncharacterized protein n=1 Tax=Periconia digitata TaxID=1303443 RepID=A0A9W4XJ84_9PLEO|nr:unnamed protein product [Periconia digitata]